MRASVIVAASSVTFICFLTIVYVCLAVHTRGYHYMCGMIFDEVAPYIWAFTGIAFCVAASITGSAIGIYTTGVTIVGAGVQAPRIRTRNLISIIFCEVVGIYGLIMAIFLTGAAEDLYEETMKKYNSHLVFGSGLIVGGVNFVCGLSVGIAGSGTALCDAARQTVFMKVLVVEIFASCLGIYGLICGVLLISKRA